MKKKKLMPKILFLGTSALVSVSFSNLLVDAEQKTTIDSTETSSNIESSSVDNSFTETIVSTKQKTEQQTTIDSTQMTSSIESSTTEKSGTTDSTAKNSAETTKTFQVKEALEATSDTPEATAATENIATVTTWTEFVKAYTDNTVTRIEFADDIAYNTGGKDTINKNARTSSLTIDGKNHKLDMEDKKLYLDPAAEGNPELTVINISDVVANQRHNWYDSEGFVVANNPSYKDSVVRHSTWTINFGNVYNQSNQYARIANNSGGQVNFIGDVKWYCNQTELVAASGVKIEDGVTVSTFKDQAGDQSFFWFDRPPAQKIDSDAGDDNMVVGKNATLNCRFNRKSGSTAYPVVFSYYKDFIVEDGATFNATMPGNAYRADYEISNFYAGKNTKINLTSLASNNSPVEFSFPTDPYKGSRTYTTDTETPRKFYVDEGSELYIEAATGASIFTTANYGSCVDIQIIKPKNLDLNNYSTAQNKDTSSILNAKSIVKNFSITNSNLTLFTTALKANGPDPSGIFEAVEYFKQSGGGDTLQYFSSEADAQKQMPLSNIRRINAVNGNPTINFIDVRNDQKSIKYETVLGMYPDTNGMDENGNINYIKLYPYAGAATADITDTYRTVHTNIPSGEDGITILKTDKFNIAGQYTSGLSYYKDKTQDPKTTYKVWDVVPPDPAVVTSSDLTEGVSSLSGTGEVGATVILKIDGKEIDAAETTVDSSGKWTLNFDPSLAKTGSVAQIFLEDHAGKADITDPPTTNNDIGNINPEEDYTPNNSEMTFKAATKVTFTKSNFTITANDMTIRAKDYPKTEDDLKALIRENSQATLTNQGTQESLDASLINVDISQLPSPSSEKVTQGKYKVTLSYTRGESTFTKDITVTISDTSNMEIKQVYKGKTDPIYSDLKEKTPVESQTIAVETGGKIEDIINQLVSDEKLTLSYDGYQSPSQVSDYKVYQDGKEVTPKPTTVPDGDFSLVYEYEGQLKFGETAQNINFGKITLSNNEVTTALDDSSDKDIEIIDTIPNGDWTLKAATTDDIKQTDGEKLPYLGSLVYKNDNGANQTINTSANKIESKQSTDTNLYSEINLKDSDQSGLYLVQNGGNLKGSYAGEIIWTLENSP